MSLVEKILVSGIVTTAAFAAGGSSLSTLHRRAVRMRDTQSGRKNVFEIHGKPRAVIIIEPDIFETPAIIAHVCQDIEDVVIARHDRAAGLGPTSVFRSSVDEYHVIGLRNLVACVDECVGEQLPIIIIGHGLGAEFSLRLLAHDRDIRRRAQSFIFLSGLDGITISAQQNDYPAWHRLQQLDQSVFSALIGTAHFQVQPSELPAVVAQDLREMNTDGIAALWARREWNAALRGPYPASDIEHAYIVMSELTDDVSDQEETWISLRVHSGTLRRHRIDNLTGRSLLLDDEISARVVSVIDEAVARI